MPAYMGAFVNATLVHALNYDDMHDALGIHVACSVFPAAFATAERVGKVAGKEFITAYTLGMDIECRLARASSKRESNKIGLSMVGYSPGTRVLWSRCGCLAGS